LRLANSAYFGLRREITSVKQAITLMGQKKVFELAASAGFSKLLPPALPGYNISSAGFWLHSIAVAILSEKLAEEGGLKVPSLLFTAGLLHDIGKLVIGSFLGDNNELLTEIKKINSDGGLHLQAEKEILGVDHMETGGAITVKWELPLAVTWGAMWHHSPQDTDEDADTVLVDVIHIADVMAHKMGYGADPGETVRSIEQDTIDRLGLDINELIPIADQAAPHIEQMGKIFL
jgi:putative nucleotidyltransferase with HDIG domain